MHAPDCRAGALAALYGGKERPIKSQCLHGPSSVRQRAQEDWAANGHRFAGMEVRHLGASWWVHETSVRGQSEPIGSIAIAQRSAAFAEWRLMPIKAARKKTAIQKIVWSRRSEPSVKYFCPWGMRVTRAAAFTFLLPALMPIAYAADCETKEAPSVCTAGVIYLCTRTVCCEEVAVTTPWPPHYERRCKTKGSSCSPTGVQCKKTRGR